MNDYSPHERPRRRTQPTERRVIRSGEVRYPGVRLDEVREVPVERPRLRPARDTGLYVERRMARERRRAQRRQTNLLALAGLTAVVLLAAGFAWRSASDKAAARLPLTPVRRTSTPVAVVAPAEPAADPTPKFAAYRGLQLRLPVQVEGLTEVGFHQASYSYALPLTTPLPDADMTAAKKARGTSRDKSTQTTGEEAVLIGSVLRMWRDRPGKPNTAVDVGAPAGTDVYAPVTGTIVKVKRYKLYNEHNDYEFHIQPDGLPNIDVVMIHIDDESVETGQRVIAGVTRIGAVRKLSDRINMQLRSYTKNGGDHVHIQLNDATDPEYEGLEGAVMASGS